MTDSGMVRSPSTRNPGTARRQHSEQNVRMVVLIWIDGERKLERERDFGPEISFSCWQKQTDPQTHSCLV